jgi:spoIIIJ-associated protein
MMNTVEKTAKTVEDAVGMALRELNCDKSQVEIEVLSVPAKGFLGILGAKDARVKVKRKGADDEADNDAEEMDAEAAGGVATGAEGGGEAAGAVAAGAESGGEAAGAVTAGAENGGGTETGAAVAGVEKNAAPGGKPRQADIAAGQAVSEASVGTAPAADDKVADFLRGVVTRMGIDAVLTKSEDEEIVRYALNGPRMGTLIGHRGDTLDALQYLTNVIASREREEPRKRILLDAESYRRRREETLVRLAQRLAVKAKRGGHRMVLEPMSPMERRVIHTALQNDPDIKTLSEGEEPYRRLVIYPAGSLEWRGERDGEQRSQERNGRRGAYRGGQRYSDES